MSKVKETTMGKWTKSIMVVNFILEGITNKTKVSPGIAMMNRWVQNAWRMNKRVLMTKKNNKWYQNKGPANRNLQQKKNVWCRKEVNLEQDEEYPQYGLLLEYPTCTLKVRPMGIARDYRRQFR